MSLTYAHSVLKILFGLSKLKIKTLKIKLYYIKLPISRLTIFHQKVLEVNKKFGFAKNVTIKRVIVMTTKSKSTLSIWACKKKVFQQRLRCEVKLKMLVTLKGI